MINIVQVPDGSDTPSRTSQERQMGILSNALCAMRTASILHNPRVFWDTDASVCILFCDTVWDIILLPPV